MAVQTRAQLDIKSNTVKNETAPSANTAARVGGLLEDLSDSVTLNGERGFASLYVDTPTGYTPNTFTEVVVNITMSNGASAGSIFSASEYTISYTGSITVGLRISCQLVFAGDNSRIYSFWIAQNGNIIPQSLSEERTQGTHNHTICLEAFVLASTGNSFEIFASSNSGNEITIQTVTFTACTI
jgi:hypothetical protein